MKKTYDDRLGKFIKAKEEKKEAIDKRGRRVKPDRDF